MNLNQDHKQAIILAVMNDVPRKHGNDDIAKRVKKVIDDDILAYAPKIVADAYFDKEGSTYFAYTGYNLGYLSSKKAYMAHMPYINMLSQYELSDGARAAISVIIEEAAEEIAAVNKVKTDLHAAISGLRTRKQFVTMFPELEKYAPEEPAAGTMLPAIANVVAGLSKLGWGNAGAEPTTA